MKIKLEDICFYSTDKINVSDLTTNNYISTENMMPNKGGVTTASTLPGVAQTRAYQENDVLLSNIRPYFKKIWFADCSGGCSNDVLVLRAKEGTDAKFLYYVLADDTFFDYSTATSKGTKMPRGDKTAIMQYEVPKLDLSTQKKVAGLLSSIDAKIDLNNEINKNLLQQAMATFGNTLQHSGSISYANLGTLGDIKGGKRLPKGTHLITEPNSHPYIRVRDLNNVVFASLSADYEYVDDETQKSISRYITSSGDVLISIVGTIGLTAIVDKSLDNANLTENCVKVTNLNGISPEYLLLYLRSPAGIEAIQKGTVGAVQLKLPIKNIQAIPVPLLPKLEVEPLEQLLLAIFRQIAANVKESKCLAETRDTLLPKLMSGELNVSNIDL